ncbi:hypothetical protein [Paenibacillus cisolokensis]|nr:hypothetical protein [Paenibacillus cisolokensis]
MTITDGGAGQRTGDDLTEDGEGAPTNRRRFDERQAHRRTGDDLTGGADG